MSFAQIIHRLRPTRRLALAAALALSAAALAPGASYAYVTKVPESTGRTDVARYVYQYQHVSITADPVQQIWSGMWFTGNNGPAGYGTANSQSPLPGAPAYSLLARIGNQYTYVGTGKDFVAQTSGWLTLFINDDVPGNGNGYFGIENLSVG